MYHKIKLKQIEFKNQNINSKDIMRALHKCYSKYAFSTFPYMNDELSSEEGLTKYNSGNCIALSIAIKNYLKIKYNIDSYLIPATIPKKYSHSGYLDISHVALAIPKNKDISYIVDPAFYFLNPIKSYKNKKKYSSIVYSKNIYQNETSNKPQNYSSLDKVFYEEKILKNDKHFNKYQTIPKNTKYSEVYYSNDTNDMWKYYMIEITNPDQSISNFFINIIKRPFIVSTKIDKNGICCMDIYLKMIDRNDKIILEITCNDKFQSINLNEIKEIDLRRKLSIYNKKLIKFFNGNLVDILLNCKRKLENKSKYFIND